MYFIIGTGNIIKSYIIYSTRYTISYHEITRTNTYANKYLSNIPKYVN